MATRERVLRTVTFWLRPAFALRLVNRFQRLVGFDRSMALASSALATIIPLTIVSGIVLTRFGPKDTAHRIIDKYRLTGGGADAVTHLFSSDAGAAGVSVLGLLFLVVSSLSFARAMQRLFEQTWELPSLSVRNSLNDLRWIGGLLLYLAATGWLYAAVGRNRLGLAATLAQIPLSAVFLVWSSEVLTARRVTRRQSLPFGLLGAVLEAVYSVGAALYLPHLFSSLADRYGAMGAVFALISALFGLMFVLVASSAIGREVRDELDRIARGERPADDEVRHEWDVVIAEARTRWQSARQSLADRRRPKGPVDS